MIEQPEEMREQIAKRNPYSFVEAGSYKPHSLQQYSDREIELLRRGFDDGVDITLIVLKEEIGKMKNPHIAVSVRESFEYCLQKILEQLDK